MPLNRRQAIIDEINRNEDFMALRLILMDQGKANVKTSRFAAWSLGEIKGQAVMAEWIETNATFDKATGELK